MPVGMQVGLDRLALDLLANRVLLAIGVRNVVVRERKQAAAQQRAAASTGTASRYRLTPLAFMAVISLCLVRMPKVIRTATSTLMGAEVKNELGRQKEQIRKDA